MYLLLLLGGSNLCFLHTETLFQPKSSCDVHGICVYFSVEFGGGGGIGGSAEEERESGGVFHRLDSSPWGEPTHWQQSVMLFKVCILTQGRHVQLSAPLGVSVSLYRVAIIS